MRTKSHLVWNYHLTLVFVSKGLSKKRRVQSQQSHRGQRVAYEALEAVPTHGTLRRGSSFMDRSWLTGDRGQRVTTPGEETESSSQDDTQTVGLGHCTISPSVGLRTM